MIIPVQPYLSNNAHRFHTPCFGAVMAKGSTISIRKRGEAEYYNVGSRIFNNFKEIIFEMLPMLDKKYQKFIRKV